MPDETQVVQCIVCGEGSHRTDWAAKKNPACDGHSAVEVANAVARAGKPAAGPVPVGAAVAKK